VKRKTCCNTHESTPKDSPGKSLEISGLNQDCIFEDSVPKYPTLEYESNSSSLQANKEKLNERKYLNKPPKGEKGRGGKHNYSFDLGNIKIPRRHSSNHFDSPRRNLNYSDLMMQPSTNQENHNTSAHIVFNSRKSTNASNVTQKDSTVFPPLKSINQPSATSNYFSNIHKKNAILASKTFNPMF
jgi:hypothetical protein